MPTTDARAALEERIKGVHDHAACDACDAWEEMLEAGYTRLRAEVARLTAERDALVQQIEAEAVYQGMLRDERDAAEARVAALERGADPLALAVLRCVDNGALDARSGPGDALLVYAGARFGVSDCSEIQRLRALTGGGEDGR